MHGGNVPTDEARLHPFTPFPHFLFCITSRSDARGNSRRRDSQQHPPYRWISGELVRQRPGPGKPHLLILLDVSYGSGQTGTCIASPESFTTGRRFQSLGLNWIWERSSPPILHLKLLLKSINFHPGCAILSNNLSSLANPLNSFCSTQFSTEQSTTETKLTYNTEFLYAFTCTSGNTYDITGPYTTMTISLSPWTRSVSKGMPQYCLHSLAPVATLSSPVTLLFCCRRYWSKIILQSFIFLYEAVSNCALNSRLAPCCCSE